MMNGTLRESIWAIEPEAIARMKAASLGSATIEIGAQLPMPKVSVMGSLAVIPIQGVMVRRASLFGALFGETSTEAISALVRTAADDSNIRTIVLLIDSPGGPIDGMFELGDTVWEARQRGGTKIIAQVDGTAASAAYYVASQAHEVWANRMDIVGSIGVKALVVDESKALEQAGVEVLSFNSGWFKSAGDPGLPISDEQKAEFQRIVDIVYADFLKVVQRGREMPAAKLKPLADGRVFFAAEAKANGLIDGIRTMAETVQRLSGGRQTNRNRAELAGALIHEPGRKRLDSVPPMS